MTSILVQSLPLVFAGLVAAAVGFGLGAFLATWVGHTERSRQEIAILRSVIRGYGWKDAEFAAAIGVTEHQLSRIFSGTDALNFHRLADLPEPFRAKWDAARAATRGARIFESDELAFVRALAELPRPQMLKMTAPLRLRKEA